MSLDQCKEPPHRIHVIIHVIIRVMQNVCKVCHDCALPVHAAEGHEEKKECVKRIPVPSVRPSLYMYMYMRAHCNKNNRQRQRRANERRDTGTKCTQKRKRRGRRRATARPRQRKVGVSGAIDVARHPRRPLNFRSLVTLSSLAQKKSLFILSLTSPCPLATVAAIPCRSLAPTKASMSRLPQFSCLSTDAYTTRRDATGLDDAQTSSFQLINVSSLRDNNYTERGIHCRTCCLSFSICSGINCVSTLKRASPAAYIMRNHRGLSNDIYARRCICTRTHAIAFTRRDISSDRSVVA